MTTHSLRVFFRRISGWLPPVPAFAVLRRWGLLLLAVGVPAGSLAQTSDGVPS